MCSSSIGHGQDFTKAEPTRRLEDGSCEWIYRASNFVVVSTSARPGARLARPASTQVDEYLVLLPAGMNATVTVSEQNIASSGDALFVVPPGDSKVVVQQAGWIHRIFSAQAQDVIHSAANHATYETANTAVAPLETWPAPEGGYRLRHYALADYLRSDTTMRLFRTRHLMVNIFRPSPSPRDIRKMTPHSHADFEQGSLALSGEFVHHLRYPWAADMTQWREDEHAHMGSPSLIVIPPPVIHTSQSLGESSAVRLVDIFAPPRDDFSLKPGLVCNADEYPLPERLKDAPPTTNAA